MTGAAHSAWRPRALPRPAADALCAAASFAATLAFQLPFFDRWFSAMDEGHVLLFSEIAADGGTLYRDATFYPLPGAFYLLALLFRVFEPSMLVARFAVVVEFALFVAVVHDLMRRATPARLAVAVVPLLWAYRLWAFPHWQMYSYTTTALLLLAGSLRLLVAHFESGRRAPLAASGLFFGLGVFCKQDYGAAALLATLAALCVAGRTRPQPASPGLASALASFLVPAAGVGLLAGLHFLERGVLGDVLRFCVWTHAYGTATFPFSSFAPPFPLFSQDPLLRTPAGVAIHFPPLVYTFDWQRVSQSALYRQTPLYELYTRALLYGPWLLVTASGWRQWRTRARLRETASRAPALAAIALLATAASFALLGHLTKPQDYIHWAVLTWPLPCVALLEAAALRRARPRLAGWLALLLLPAALAAFAYTGRLAWLLRTRNDSPVQLERAAGLHLQPDEARLLEDLVATVERETEPGEPIAVFPYFPLLHFLADRPGPHRAGYIVWPVPEIEDRDRALITAIETQKIRLVIYHFTQFLTLPRAEVYAAELFAYLVERFEIFDTFHAGRFGFKLAALRRESGPPAGRPLFETLDTARLRVERSGATREIRGAERDAMLRRELWPFRPALALRPSADGRSVLSLPLRAAAGERLHTAVGTHPEQWFAYPPSRASFRIDVVQDGARETLYERTLDPQREIADRGWFEVELPLDAWVGREVTLELSTATDRSAGETPLLSGFAEPRLVPGSAPPGEGP